MPFHFQSDRTQNMLPYLLENRTHKFTSCLFVDLARAHTLIKHLVELGLGLVVVVVVPLVVLTIFTYFCFDMLQYRVKICRFDRRLGRYYFDRRIRTRRWSSGGRFLRGGRRGTRRTFLSQRKTKTLETSLSSRHDVHRDRWRRYFLFGSRRSDSSRTQMEDRLKMSRFSFPPCQ